MFHDINVRTSLTKCWMARILKYVYDIFEGHKFSHVFHNFCYRRRIINVPSVHLDYKRTVGTIIKWNSSSTDDVCNGNRRPINSRHTEVCHLRLNKHMFCGIHDDYNAFPTTIPAVLADSLLHCFFLRVWRDHQHIQQYFSKSLQSCDSSKQLLQGEKRKKL